MIKMEECDLPDCPVLGNVISTHNLSIFCTLFIVYHTVVNSTDIIDEIDDPETPDVTNGCVVIYNKSFLIIVATHA